MTQLVEIVGRFMFGEQFPGAIRTRLTTRRLRVICRLSHSRLA